MCGGGGGAPTLRFIAFLADFSVIRVVASSVVVNVCLAVLESVFVPRSTRILSFMAYGSLVLTGGIGNPPASFSYKSDGISQSSRSRFCTSVNGDNSRCV